MQLRTFAERVLFGTTLEEKLNFPQTTLVDTLPGAPLKTPTTLPRPPELQLKAKGVQLPHPKLHQLHQDQERGKLLHFFCNHELLATELMALVLLKFPDAPPSFRQGVLHTLKEEQIHTQLYINRMQACGIYFGDLPVNGYFWNTIAPMQDPLDYVTRLSLTFEQANLDYAKTYAAVFQTMGDPATAKILDKIYRDEIGHVGFGLKWFRQWKSKTLSDWQAYKAQLHFPLSPSRAKGPHFNAAGRKAVGFDELFIRELSLFSQSKGRTPQVFYFNPGVELELAQAQLPAPTTPPHAQQLNADLATVPIFLAQQDDIALIPQRPAPHFLSKLQAAGFKLPEIIETKHDWQHLVDRNIHSLRPWAWAPSTFPTLAPLFAQTAHPPQPWHNAFKHLYSKAWSAQWLRDQLPKWQTMPWLLPANAIGQPVATLADAVPVIDTLRSQGYRNIVLKAPFGVSGRNQQRLLDNAPLTPQTLRWLQRMIEQQSCIVIEPWLHRVLDFSIHYEKTESTLTPMGITRLHNTPQGQFTAVSTHALTRDCSADIQRFVFEKETTRPRLLQFFETHFFTALHHSLQTIPFIGPISIDAFVYRTPNNELRLKPVVEINPRYTFGRLALELQRNTQNNLPSTVALTSRSAIQRQGYTTFSAYTAQREAQHPLQLNAVGKITSGFIPLNDPAAAQSFLMTYAVTGSE